MVLETAMLRYGSELGTREIEIVRIMYTRQLPVLQCCHCAVERGQYVKLFEGRAQTAADVAQPTKKVAEGSHALNVRAAGTV